MCFQYCQPQNVHIFRPDIFRMWWIINIAEWNSTRAHYFHTRSFVTDNWNSIKSLRNQSAQNQGITLLGDKVLRRRMILQGRCFFFTVKPQMEKQVHDHRHINHANNDRSRYSHINVWVRISICSNFKNCCLPALQQCFATLYAEKFIFSPNAFVHQNSETLWALR